MPPRSDPEPAAVDRERLTEWFVRRTGDSWREQDETEFQRWLDAEPANRRAWQRWESDWALMDHFPLDSIDRLQAMVQADRAASGRAGVHRVQPAARASHRHTFMRAAAMAGLAGLVASAVWLNLHDAPRSPSYEHTFLAARGQQIQDTLPDGTQLHLDTATTLHARFDPTRREVHLVRGQLFLSVQSEPHRPFLVHAGQARVSVVGTRFAVRFTPEIAGRSSVEVVVDEGWVRVESTNPVEAVQPRLLGSGEKLVVAPGTAPTAAGRIAQDEIAPWRQRQLSFSDVKLTAALAELDRYTDLGIAWVDPSAAEQRLSGTFLAGDAESARKLLAAALPVRFERHAQGWHLLAQP